MTFYIYVNAEWQQIYVEIEPKLAKAFDTTNDTFSCVLKANNIQSPYKPMTPFKIIDDSNNTTLMWIVNDNVTVFSLSKELYKHTLSLVQYRYFLNKHLLRNTVFNQPREKIKKMYMAVSSVYAKTQDDVKWSYRLWSAVSGDATPKIWYEELTLNPHTKIKNGKINIRLYGVRRTNTNPRTQQLTRITDLTNLSTYNAQLLSSNQVICAVMDGATEVTTFQPLSYLYNGINEFTQLDNSVLTDIQNYLALNSGATLTFQYRVNGQTTNVWNLAFADTIDGTIADSQTNASYWALLTLQVEIEFELYNYTMYDVLDTMLKQHRLTYSGLHQRELLFNLPASGDLYDLLTTTYPPDTLSFTQATFYDALTEIFRFYDAGFKFDENKTLQIEYYNDPQKEITLSSSGIQINHSEKDYNNGRIAYYQNAVQKLNFGGMNPRCNSLGVPQKSEFEIVLPKPIYSIEKLTYLLKGTFDLSLRAAGELSSAIGTSIDIDLDISYFTIYQEIWSALSTRTVNTNDFTILTQQNTIPFNRGANSINISSYYKDVFNFENDVLGEVVLGGFYRFLGYNTSSQEQLTILPSLNTQTWENQRFNISYLANINGRLQVETLENKYKGEQIVNQSDGLININKLGLNILGESLKNGEPVLSAKCSITNWNDRIKEGDYFIDSNGQYWVANIVNYSILKDGVYQANIEFSKNFNALSLRVRSEKEKRLTNISREQAVISEDNFIEYIYVFDYNDSQWGTLYSSSVIGLLNLKDFLADTFLTRNNNNVEGACVISSDAHYYTYIPLMKYGAGNCICFEMQFDDPINAGNQLQANQTGWWSGTKYFSKATPYTDNEGWLDTLSINFIKQYSFDGKFPVLDTFSTWSNIINLKYYKKPNEIFALNYELCFLSLYNRTSKIKEIFIGNAFINNNVFTLSDKIYGKKFYLRYTLASDNDSTRYSILDVKGYGNHQVEISGITTIQSAYSIGIGFKTANSINAKTWAIVDENNDIYFACNTEKTFNNSNSNYQLGLTISRTRKDFDYH